MKKEMLGQVDVFVIYKPWSLSLTSKKHIQNFHFVMKGSLIHQIIEPEDGSVPSLVRVGVQKHVRQIFLYL